MFEMGIYIMVLIFQAGMALGKALIAVIVAIIAKAREKKTFAPKTLKGLGE